MSLNTINLGSQPVISDYEWAAIALSLKVAFIAVVASAPFAIVCAWVLAKKEFKAKALLDCLIHLPLVLPPVVIGYLLLVVMGRQGVIGQWLYQWFGLTFSFSWRGAALAAAVVSFPLMVRSIRQSLEAIDHRLEQAARTMGASSPSDIFSRHLTSVFAWGIIGCGAGLFEKFR